MFKQLVIFKIIWLRRVSSYKVGSIRGYFVNIEKANSEQFIQWKSCMVTIWQSVYTLFQNGPNFSTLLFTCKLALVASFKGKYSFEFRVQERGNKG